MRTHADTSALIALLYPDDEHNERAAALLGDAAAEGRVAISPITYAELAPDFGDREDLDAFVDDTGIAIDAPGRDALFAAGAAFQRYLDDRGDRLDCPACGASGVSLDCPDCGEAIAPRQHPPSDFLIGAQAERDADRLLTFDAGFFRRSFDVEVVGIAE